MTGEGIISMKKCPTCGKKFAVLYPQLWAYKRGTQKGIKFFCTWRCLRAADDKKGKKMMDNGENKKTIRRDPIELAKELLQEIEEGRNPVKYMESLGYKNPQQAYMELKQRVRKIDPQLGARFPTRQTKKKPEIPEQVPAVKVDGAIRIETPEACKVEVVETPEKPGEHYQYTAIMVSGLGEFYHDRKYNTVDWRNEEGDEISMSPFSWLMLSKELPSILKRIGAIK